MSISFNAGFNPEEYAKLFASQNNVSIDSARESLKTQYGEPSQDNASIFGSETPSFNSLTSDTFTSSTGQNDDISSYFEQDNEEGQGILETIMNFFKELGSGNEMNSSENGTQQDPNDYAQTYADENGLSLDDAKAELKEKYGDPQQDGSNFFKELCA